MVADVRDSPRRARLARTQNQSFKRGDISAPCVVRVHTHLVLCTECYAHIADKTEHGSQGPHRWRALLPRTVLP